ncbi:MAG: GntR family transcriptional regulator [Spirochaetaceae bacterium]|nr:GntR family transcriptional regulator [Spirochaetaceae bacterium]
MEFTETQAIYQQVADHVCEMILRAGWPEEGRIPSVRELAMGLQVNPNTVNKGYAYLQDRGIIHNQRGIGYFVSEGAVNLTRDLKRAEFVAVELPRVFKTMTLIGMDLSELAEQWDQFRRQESEGETI